MCEMNIITLPALFALTRDLVCAGGAASEGAVAAPPQARGPGERPAAAAGGARISGAEGPGRHAPA